MSSRQDPGALIDRDRARLWLAGVAAQDPGSALDALTTALTGMSGRGSFTALTVLEMLRAPMLGWIGQIAERYIDKPLPLQAVQTAALVSADAACRALALAYRECAVASLADRGEYHRHAALAHQRSIAMLVAAMTQYLRAHRRHPEGLWTPAHELIDSALRLQLAEAPVRDSMHPEGRSTVQATYARGLLLLAAGARSITAREFDHVCQLALYFERKPVLIGGRTAPPEARVRRLREGAREDDMDVTELAKSVGGRLATLNRGEPVEVPALTPAPSAQAMRNLYARLYSAWCARTNQRRFPRHRRLQEVFCAFEPEHVYSLLKRRPYSPPPPPKVYNHREVANIYVTTAEAPPLDQSHSPESWRQVADGLERWQLIEESATGMSIARTAGRSRVRRGQLVALRMGDAGAAMIAEIRWAEEVPAGNGTTVEAGLEMLPGFARAGAARYTDAAMIARSAGQSGSSPALIVDSFSRNRGGPKSVDPLLSKTGRLLSLDEPVPDLPDIDVDMVDRQDGGPRRRYSQNATIALPTGWTREGSEIEFLDGAQPIRLRLGAVAARHGEFERFSFSLLS